MWHVAAASSALSSAGADAAPWRMCDDQQSARSFRPWLDSGLGRFGRAARRVVERRRRWEALCVAVRWSAYQRRRSTSTIRCSLQSDCAAGCVRNEANTHPSAALLLLPSSSRLRLRFRLTSKYSSRAWKRTNCRLGAQAADTDMDPYKVCADFSWFMFFLWLFRAISTGQVNFDGQSFSRLGFRDALSLNRFRESVFREDHVNCGSWWHDRLEHPVSTLA